MNRLSRVLVVVLVLVSVCCGGTIRASSGATVEAHVAAPNPSFLNYVAAGTRGSGAVGTGLIPSPVDWSYLDGQQINWADSDTAIPSSYDLRTEGRVTAVRNQGSSGSCWAFAAYGSLESTSLPDQTLDLSENNLKNTAGFDYLPNSGGNAQMAAAYLARWSGPISEADDPYDPASTTSTPNLNPVDHVQNILMLPQRSGSLDTADIKRAIMDYGALYGSMYWTDYSYNANTSAYRYTGSSDSNHAITVVGWNDAFPASSFGSTPAGNGAWIAKNSWGTSWGSSGYFYISYYDSVLFKGQPAYCFQKAEPTSNYTRVYQYDPLGETYHMNYGSLTTGWAANKFVAAAAETVRAVGFYTTVPNTSYEVRVYGGWRAPQFTDLLSTQTGVTAAPGYHTVVLSSPAMVASGQVFGVVVKVQATTGTAPISIEAPVTGYSTKATAVAGQSYVSSDGLSWYDLVGMCSNANVCIKAYAGVPGRTYTITPSHNVGGTTAPSTVQTVFEGTDRTFTMVPQAGYHLTDIAVDGTSIGAMKSDYTFSNVQANHTISATFAPSQYQIIVAYPSNGGVSKTPDKTYYSYNDSVTLKATPLPGYCFTGWSGALTGTANPQTIIVTHEITVGATFAKALALNVSSSPTAGGTVAKSPDQTAYVSGTVVTLTATPAAGYAFSGWSGDLTGTTNPATVTMTADKTVTATFTALPSYALSVSALPTAGGTVAKSPDQTAYVSGTVVTLTATPAAGYAFSGWSGDLTGTTNPATVTMTADKTVTATFTALPSYALSVSALPTAGGTVAKSPDQTAYVSGTVVTLTATPAAGYAFSGWSGDLTGTTNPATVTMDDDRTVTAVFAALGPLITSSSPLPAATVGERYDVEISAVGGTAPLEWSLTEGTLPVGLQLGLDGALTGTPSVAGDYVFTVRVTDHAGLHADQVFALHVNMPPTGTVEVRATLDGVAWAGPIDFQVSGASLLTGVEVPSVFEEVSTGSWTFSVTGGGPAGAAVAGVTPAYSQTLAAGRILRFTVCYETPDYVGVGGLRVTSPLGPDYRGAVLTVTGRAYGTPPVGSTLTVSVYCASTGVDTVILTQTMPIAATDWTASVSAQDLGITGTNDVEIRARLAGFPKPTEVVLPVHWSVTPTFTLTLASSWNLVSVPAPLPVSSITGFRSGYGYHDGWSQLSAVSVLTPGEAYWIDVEDAVTIPLFEPSPAGPVTLTYQAGWQFLGDPFEVSLPISSITGSTLITACYSYGPQWSVIDMSTGVLEPGKGYWVQLSAPTTLTLKRP